MLFDKDLRQACAPARFFQGHLKHGKEVRGL
jgi:hypothetical protein